MTGPEFSQEKLFTGMAKGATEEDARSKINGATLEINAGDALGRKLEAHYKTKESDVKKAKKLMFSMLAQMSRASQDVPGFDTYLIYPGDKFEFKGNTVEISRTGKATMILSLDQSAAHQKTVENSREAVEGTRVEVANKWIDRGILSGVALVGAGINNWKEGRDRFIGALETVSGFPTPKVTDMEKRFGKYSASYNMAVIEFLKGLKDAGTLNAAFWQKMREKAKAPGAAAPSPRVVPSTEDPPSAAPEPPTDVPATDTPSVAPDDVSPAAPRLPEVLEALKTQYKQNLIRGLEKVLFINNAIEFDVTSAGDRRVTVKPGDGSEYGVEFDITMVGEQATKITYSVSKKETGSVAPVGDAIEVDLSGDESQDKTNLDAAYAEIIARATNEATP